MMIAKTTLMAAATAMTLAAALPSYAQAQPAPDSRSGYYDSQGRYYYDACKRDQNNRALTGAVVGGILGAVVGHSLAGRHVQTEGAVLGGGVGAIGGAAVGAGSAACTPGQTQRSYYDGDRGGPYSDNYDQRDDSGYDDSQNDAPRYNDRVDGRAAYDADQDDDDYAYDSGGRAYPVSAGSVQPDGCALAESTIYMPDGQVQKRFVRVCRDRGGRYQVVE